MADESKQPSQQPVVREEAFRNLEMKVALLEEALRNQEQRIRALERNTAEPFPGTGYVPPGGLMG